VDQSTIKWGVDIKKVQPAVLASLEPIIRFFSYHDAHPIALTMVLMEKFGVEWFEWEPETLKSEILTTFRATSISPHNWEKIQAVRTLTQTVGFWKEWHLFEKVTQALNNNVPRFDISQRCSLAQLMAGIDIAGQVRQEQYDDEVARYVACCALDEGVVYLPPPLEFAQEVLAQPMYRCKVCGQIDTDDLDGRCDFCCGRFQDERPLNMRPSPHVPADAGTQVEKFVARDYTQAEERFTEVRHRGIKNVKLDEEVPEDVQAAKLVVACEYMQLRRTQLVEQLEELKSWVTH
jgi:hypothetical protein